jgi:formate hydrogenlyase subunit 3/multisubunit Na+/H+ antiporter MnhD subunit
MYILFIGAFVVYILQNDAKRKQVIFGILIFSLVLNSFLCVMYIFYIFNDSNLKGTYIIIELILIFGLIATQFSKRELMDSSNNGLYDSLMLIIIFGLIGIVLTTNIMSIILWFLFLSLIFGVIFFIDNFKKELELLKLYFIVLIISAICLIGATILIYLATGSLELDVINGIQISEELNNFISIILYLGIGLLCGLVPFSIFHLKNFFQDNSYANLLLFSIFIYIISFIAIRILNVVSYESLIVSFTLITLLILGIILPMVYIPIELFTHIDGNTYSIKKIFGYSVVLDFNMVLLFVAFSNLLTTPLNEIFLNSIIYFLLTIFSVKMLIFYTFYPVTINTDEDNIKLLGGFKNEYRKFGTALFISGLIIIVLLGFLLLNNTLPILFSYEIASNSLYSLTASIVLTVYVLFLIVFLIFISTNFNYLYNQKEHLYLQRNGAKNISSIDFMPIIVLFAIIICLSLSYIFFNNFFYDLFKDFFYM